MGRKCLVCSHPQRKKIDKLLARGDESISELSRKFGVPWDSLKYHYNNHLPKTLVPSPSSKEIAVADNLLQELLNIRERAFNLLERAEAKEDLKAAGTLLRELREQLKLWAELEGRLSQQTQVNVLVNPQWVELRALILNVLDEHPEAKEALINAFEKRGIH